MQRADWSSLDLAAEAPGKQVRALYEALDGLAQRDPLGAELIKLCHFTGLPNVEAAELPGIS